MPKKLQLNELHVKSFETHLNERHIQGGKIVSDLTTYSSTKDYHPECTLFTGCETKIHNTVCIHVY